MSRLLWFFIGAGVGTWWATNKRMSVNCEFKRTLPAPSIPTSESAPFISNNTSDPRHLAQYNQAWEQERERVQKFSQSAGDAVAELSEATLSTIIQATEALKAKMAEHRAMREEEKRIEQERRNPPRFV
ncbi:hypothetical protein C8J57DRAFT_1278971 [Mycena rebaudengoi]|nr:hypothetical protein C8J57DRAFT_1278971 [Mycena rebaudengoi]